MTERTINSTLRTMLIENEPFDYCHLIKFERPSLPTAASGSISTSKERYTYITDASRDVLFNDNSASLDGVPNGVQTYVANKVINVGSITEDSEAKATTFNIDLDGTAIGAYCEATVSIVSATNGTYDILFPDSSLLDAGFREGDKVTIGGIASSGDFNIVGFRANNVVRFSVIDTAMTPENTVEATFSLSSEEIKSILLDKNSAEYASFINREVYVWKAFFQGGELVDDPVLIFKGLISNASFEDTETNVKVSWGMTSHWGDWSQVSGRITSDDFHRALDSSGNPNPASAIKPAYAYDKGFAHAETSINLLANYTTLVEKQDVSVKKKFFGLVTKVKVRNYLAQETRSTELDFQLQAKSLPVVYGVRPIKGIPIFADTLKDDSSSVYVIYALSEGEISSIYDVYVDGNSLICGNKSDSDARSVQNADNTVPLVCLGRADRGDVLGGAIATEGSPVSYYESESYLYDLGYNLIDKVKYLNYIEPVVQAPVTSSGIMDGQTLTLTSPQNIVMDFFSGKPGQDAAQSLVNIAKAGGFKVQTDYWSGTDTAEYWGPNHRLLDTAYVVVKYKIAEGETTIPDLEFIVNGKVIPCYNYDYSYSNYDKVSEDADNFPLGSYVSLYRSDTNALINSNVQIIDKWTIYNPDGSPSVRFRFSTAPSLNYIEGVPAITKFYMSNGGSNWTMVTYNHKESEGSPAREQSVTIGSIYNEGGKLAIEWPNTPEIAVGGDPIDRWPKFSVLSPSNAPIVNDKFTDALVFGPTNGTSVITEMNFNTNFTFASLLIGNKLVSRNTIALAGSASGTNDYYVGYDITVTKVNSFGRLTTQTKTVVAYDGATKIATIDGLWDISDIPTSSDTYHLVQGTGDKRSTNNFAMIALDYCSSKSYGRGFSETDISLPSWLEAARDCDQQSDVTLRLTNASSTIEAGDVYSFNGASGLLWQGEVLSVFDSSAPGITTRYATFTNVIGKLSNLWNSWKVFPTGSLVYHGSNLYRVLSGYTPGNTAPTHSSGSIDGLEFISTVSVSKISGAGGSTEGLFSAGNPVQGIKGGRIASGYSLYDSDGIDYWKYVGWSAHDQRYVTKHQGNLVIDTSQPVFDNVNSILSHFGGILRYSSGKYYLDIEKLADEISGDSPYHISEEDIIGKINLTDEGIRAAYNSLAVSYADPSNKYEARNISFFNSEYLKADRNVPRKGNLSIPGITNYYNARLLADKYLNKSRYGLQIAVTVRPKGLLYVPGKILHVTYPKYGWNVAKKFRIESVTIGEDSLVDVVATEYDDIFYQISNVSKQTGSGQSGLPAVTIVNSPSNLSATELLDSDDTTVTINLTWQNSSTANASSTKTEIYQYSKDIKVVSILSNVLTSATPHNLSIGDVVVPFITGNGVDAGDTYYVHSTPSTTSYKLQTALGDIVSVTNGTLLAIYFGKHSLLTTVDFPVAKYSDVVFSEESVSKYYRIRHRVNAATVNNVSTDNYSEFYPPFNSTAILGSTEGVPKLINGQLSSDVAILYATNAGVVSNFSNASGTFSVFLGTDLVDPAEVTFSVLSGDGCVGTINTSGAYSVSAMSTDTAKLNMEAAYGGVTINKSLNLAKVKEAAPGTNGTPGSNSVTVTITNDSFGVFAYAEGTVPSWAGADGYVKVYSGGTEVTSVADLSVTPSGLTGTVNTANSNPVPGFVKGYYRVTDMPGDAGTLTINVVYNSVTYTRVFSVSKVKTGYEIVNSLPTTNLFIGRMVFLTTDQKLYRYTSSGWTAAVPAVDISGQLQSAQLAGLEASKITGQLTDAQIQSIAAAKLGGQLTNAQIESIAAAKLTGTITGTQIGSNSITSEKIVGATITAFNIAGNTITGGNIAGGTITGEKIAGTTITGANIVGGTITGEKIAGNTITAAKIEAGSITGNEIKFNTLLGNHLTALSIDSDKIQANAINANKILAGAITTDKIEAGAITAAKISVTSLSALSANIGNITSGYLSNFSGSTYLDLNESRLQFTGGGYVLRQGAGMGANSDLVLWYGLSAYGHFSMTRTNGVFALGTDGKVYYGTTELNSGGGAASFVTTPSTPFAAGYSSGNGSTAFSESVFMSSSGGSGSINYYWELLSGDTGTFISDPNASGVYWYASMSQGQYRDSFWRVSARDSTGKVTLADVRVSLIETS